MSKPKESFKLINKDFLDTYGICDYSKKIENMLKRVSITEKEIGKKRMDYIFNPKYGRIFIGSFFSFYNCRENSRVYCFGEVDSTKGNKCIFIEFGEVRNSDSIYVDIWEDSRGMNPPTISNKPEIAYKNRDYFGFDEFEKAVDFIKSSVLMSLKKQLIL